MKKILLGSMMMAAAAMAVGCAVETTETTDEEQEVSVEEALRTTVQAGTFRLYAEPRHVPNPSCDVFTQLELAQGHYATATLSEQLRGFCEIYVQPNQRTYRLRQTGTSCGSKIYSGSRKTKEGSFAIEITDHRTRTCKDLVPAKIIVKETRPASPRPITTTKYSLAVAQPVTAEGTLVRTMGIGGENTGYSIRTANGLSELVLDANEQALFVDGKKARVTGTPITLSGVETRDRSAIDVSAMLVCPNPTTFNCMPGPNVRLSHYCAPENRPWVSANCAGVSYLD